MRHGVLELVVRSLLKAKIQPGIKFTDIVEHEFTNLPSYFHFKINVRQAFKGKTCLNSDVLLLIHVQYTPIHLEFTHLHNTFIASFTISHKSVTCFLLE